MLIRVLIPIKCRRSARKTAKLPRRTILSFPGQRRIVPKVSELMAWVDALETQLAASRATAANLPSALVADN
jgi:hypothetical protein